MNLVSVLSLPPLSIFNSHIKVSLSLGYHSLLLYGVCSIFIVENCVDKAVAFEVKRFSFNIFSSFKLH